MFVENYLWRILWEEFLEKNFGEELLQEQAPNSDFLILEWIFVLKQGENAARFFFFFLFPPFDVELLKKLRRNLWGIIFGGEFLGGIFGE